MNYPAADITGAWTVIYPPPWPSLNVLHWHYDKCNLISIHDKLALRSSWKWHWEVLSQSQLSLQLSLPPSSVTNEGCLRWKNRYFVESFNTTASVDVLCTSSSTAIIFIYTFDVCWMPNCESYCCATVSTILTLKFWNPKETAESMNNCLSTAPVRQRGCSFTVFTGVVSPSGLLSFSISRPRADWSSAGCRGSRCRASGHYLLVLRTDQLLQSRTDCVIL